MRSPPGTVCSSSTQLPELLRPGKGTKHTAHLGLCPCGESEWLMPGNCMKCRAHLGQCPSRAPWSLSSVDLGNTHCLGLWQTQCGPSTASTPPTYQWYLFAVSLPPHNTTEQVSLNKWPPLPPCVRVEIRYQTDLQTEKAKINKDGGTALDVTSATD